MKIFLVGDSYSGTGPANVTKYYIKFLPKGSLHQVMRNKFLRVPELIVKSVLSDVILFSGYSRQNLLGIKIAKLFKKKTAYLMHGCVEYENAINHEEDEEMCRVERMTLKGTDLILAVSPSFADWLKEHYSEYAYKTDYIANAIDDSLLEQLNADDEVLRNRHMVFTVGGGMPRKKIVYICKAIEILRQEFDKELMLTVAGNVGADSDEIDSFDFVRNEGLVPFDRTVQLYKEAALFVQNSCFETFGLAFVEAVSLGCSSLVSDKVGALCLVDNVRECDVIEHYDDPFEIAEKMKVLLKDSNASFLKENISWENNTWEIRSRQLVQKLEQLLA